MDKNYNFNIEIAKELYDLFSGFSGFDGVTINFQIHQNELIVNFDNEFQFCYNDGCEVRLVILNGQHEFDEDELILFEKMRGITEDICGIVFLDDEED